MKKGPEIGTTVLYHGIDLGAGDAEPEHYVVISHPYKNKDTGLWMLHARRCINNVVHQIMLANVERPRRMWK